MDGAIGHLVGALMQIDIVDVLPEDVVPAWSVGGGRRGPRGLTHSSSESCSSRSTLNRVWRQRARLGGLGGMGHGGAAGGWAGLRGMVAGNGMDSGMGDGGWGMAESSGDGQQAGRRKSRAWIGTTRWWPAHARRASGLAAHPWARLAALGMDTCHRRLVGPAPLLCWARSVARPSSRRQHDYVPSLAAVHAVRRLTVPSRRFPAPCPFGALDQCWSCERAGIGEPASPIAPGTGERGRVVASNRACRARMRQFFHLASSFALSSTNRQPQAAMPLDGFPASWIDRSQSRYAYQTHGCKILPFFLWGSL